MNTSESELKEVFPKYLDWKFLDQIVGFKIHEEFMDWWLKQSRVIDSWFFLNRAPLHHYGEDGYPRTDFSYNQCYHFYDISVFNHYDINDPIIQDDSNVEKVLKLVKKNRLTGRHMGQTYRWVDHIQVNGIRFWIDALERK